MTTPNRAAQINKLYKVLKKHYKAVAAPSGRTVLEHFLYACCLENSPFEQADEAFAKLQQSYFDWNEVRVTTVAELSEVFTNLPDRLATATNVKRGLQSIFEAHFSFDLEPLKKQNLGKSQKDLEKYAGGDTFVVAYVSQHGLGGHAIPCGKAELDLLVLLGVITAAEAAKQQTPGMERAVPKSKGIEFASLFHQLAVDFHTSPFSTRVKSLLLEIDPAVKDRLPKRTAKKEEPVAAPPPEKSPATKKTAATQERKVAEKPPLPPPGKPPKSELTGKKSQKPTQPKAPGADAKKPESKKPATPESRKSDSKQLAKKKPR